MSVEELKTKIRGIDWFENCGREVDLGLSPEPLRVSEPEQVVDQDADWEEVTNLAYGDLHVFIQRKRVLAPHEWNKVVAANHEFLRNEVNASFERKLGELGLPQIAPGVESNLLAALTEEHFSKHRPPRFFKELIQVFEAGCLPCGWQGDWPSGRLMVY